MRRATSKAVSTAGNRSTTDTPTEAVVTKVETKAERLSREAREVADRVKGLSRPDWLDLKHAKAGDVPDVEAGVTYVRDATDLVEDADRAVTYDAALLFHAVSKAGLIGKDCRYPTQQAFGTAIDRSKGQMSKLKVVAHGIVEHGITPGTKAYTMLASHPGAAVTEAVTKGTDSKAVRDTLAGYLAETKANGGVTRSASTPPARLGTVMAGGETVGEDTTEAHAEAQSTEASEPVDTWTVVKSALDALDESLKAHASPPRSLTSRWTPSGPGSR